MQQQERLNMAENDVEHSSKWGTRNGNDLLESTLVGGTMQISDWDRNR